MVQYTFLCRKIKVAKEIATVELYRLYVCPLFAFTTICTEVSLLLYGRELISRTSRKEGVIQQWLSTGDAIYSEIEIIKAIFPPLEQRRSLCECIFSQKRKRSTSYDILTTEFSLVRTCFEWDSVAFVVEISNYFSFPPCLLQLFFQLTISFFYPNLLFFAASFFYRLNIKYSI